MKLEISHSTDTDRWMEGMATANVMYFLQCKDCENCSKTSYGHFCDKHIHGIDNPNVDGCTWGNEKEDGERGKGE